MSKVSRRTVDAGTSLVADGMGAKTLKFCTRRTTRKRSWSWRRRRRNVQLTLAFSGGYSGSAWCSFPVIKRVDCLLRLLFHTGSPGQGRFSRLAPVIGWHPADVWGRRPVCVSGEWRQVPHSCRNSVPCRQRWRFGRTGGTEITRYL